MKSFARISLLVLWLFAIIAPSVITLIDVDNPIVVTNLNEEEQEESVKKTQAEEKFVHEKLCDFSLIANTLKSVTGNYYLISHIDYTSEIILPPPEPIG